MRQSVFATTPLAEAAAAGWDLAIEHGGPGRGCTITARSPAGVYVVTSGATFDAAHQEFFEEWQPHTKLLARP